MTKTLIISPCNVGRTQYYLSLNLRTNCYWGARGDDVI